MDYVHAVKDPSGRPSIFIPWMFRVAALVGVVYGQSHLIWASDHPTSPKVSSGHDPSAAVQDAHHESPAHATVEASPADEHASVGHDSATTPHASVDAHGKPAEPKEASHKSEEVSSSEVPILTLPEASQKGVCAGIRQSRGATRWFPPGGGAFEIPRVKQVLDCGGHVQVFEGLLELEHRRAHSLLLSRGTYAKLESLSPSSPVVQLYRGKLLVRRKGDSSSFQVVTPSGRMALGQGVYLIGYDPDRSQTWIVAIEGSASFENRFIEGTRIQVAQGEMSELQTSAGEHHPRPGRAIVATSLSGDLEEFYLGYREKSLILDVIQARANRRVKTELSKKSPDDQNRTVASIAPQESSGSIEKVASPSAKLTPETYKIYEPQATRESLAAVSHAGSSSPGSDESSPDIHQSKDHALSAPPVALGQVTKSRLPASLLDLNWVDPSIKVEQSKRAHYNANKKRLLQSLRHLEVVNGDE